MKPPSSRYLSTIYSNIVIADININTAPALGPAAADPEDTTADSFRHIRVIVKYKHELQNINGGLSRLSEKIFLLIAT